MNRDSLQYWSLSCGTWFDTQVRVSIFLIPVLAIVGYQLGSLKLGLIFCTLYFLAILMHEFGHVVAARQTGGNGNEILVWPLGGLAFVQPSESFASQMMTTAAGPLVNFAMCAITLWPVWSAGHLPEAFYPLRIPVIALEGSTIVSDLLLLVFCTNWVLLAINLLPVFPLDGGKMVQVCLRSRYGTEGALDLSMKIGYVAAAIAMGAGLALENHWVVFLGAILFIMNMAEATQTRPSDNFDDSFMGYDFSQGYTSLEKSRETRPPRRPGFFERWRERRRVEKQKRLQLQEEQEQQQLDALLQKVHTSGIESLSDSERRKLQHMSERLRGRGKTGN